MMDWVNDNEGRIGMEWIGRKGRTKEWMDLINGMNGMDMEWKEEWTEGLAVNPRTRLDVVDGHRAHHQRHHGIRRNAQREQGMKRFAHQRYWLTPRCRDATDVALAEGRLGVGAGHFFSSEHEENRRAAHRHQEECRAASRAGCRE